MKKKVKSKKIIINHSVILRLKIINFTEYKLLSILLLMSSKIYFLVTYLF
jgi:hypothetical protein